MPRPARRNRPELCDFTTPSLLDRDPVLVAIGTDGASAGLAKHLRLRLDALVQKVEQNIGVIDTLFALANTRNVA